MDGYRNSRTLSAQTSRSDDWARDRRHKKTGAKAPVFNGAGLIDRR